MSTQRMTLSFLTESKGSHVGITSMRRVAITLLVMLLTTVSAWAEDVPTYSISTLLTPMNGGTIDVLTQAKQGTKVRFTVTPADGYAIEEVLLSDSQNTLEGNSKTGSYSFTMGTSNVLITVVFKKGWVVTFDANGGTGTMKHVIVANGTKYTIPECGFTGPSNLAFLGWSTSANGDVEYQPGDKVKINNDLTLYAIWDYILKYNIINEKEKQVELTGYEGGKPRGTLNIPATITIDNKEYSVTSIGNHTFEGCISLTSVTIPNGVTSIGYEAFRNCTSLQSVDIPNSVTSIGDNAFRNCAILQSVIIPENVTSIGNHTFEDCISLTSVTIPNSVTSIGNNAFFGCGSLTSVTIPNSVTSIGEYAFYKCTSLESVTIPNSVTSIGEYAFYKCTSLESVTIPTSVTSIAKETFRKCKSLTSVTIPNSVTSIGDRAFEGCEDLESITINGNPKIGEDAFLNTPVTVTMNLKASKIGEDYWTTFYHDGYNFQADEYTTVYKGTVDDSSLMLTEVADRIVNSGTAVILKSTGNPVMTLTDANSSDTNNNSLRGISDRTSLTEVKSANNANTIYTLGNTSAGFGFHKYTGEYVPFNKAFLPLNIENGAKPILNMVFANETTGINALSSDDNALQNDWFSLDGTRLNGKPTQRGIYINGNKKVVVK